MNRQTDNACVPDIVQHFFLVSVSCAFFLDIAQAVTCASQQKMLVVANLNLSLALAVCLFFFGFENRHKIMLVHPRRLRD